MYRGIDPFPVSRYVVCARSPISDLTLSGPLNNQHYQLWIAYRHV